MLFCATTTVLCFTPGPAVLLVISQSLTRGARAGVLASLGICSTNAGYFALSATSLGAVLVASWEVFSVIKWVGAGYLLWIGARMVFARRQDGLLLDTATTPPSARRAYPLAVLTQGANPKALVFFTAIVPQFVNPAVALLPQMLILGVTTVVIEFVVLSLYVATSQTARTWVIEAQRTAALRRIGGACLMAAGVRLALVRRG
jgi:homoserine/homoserine lactone efflux protein